MHGGSIGLEGRQVITATILRGGRRVFQESSSSIPQSSPPEKTSWRTRCRSRSICSGVDPNRRIIDSVIASATSPSPENTSPAPTSRMTAASFRNSVRARMGRSRFMVLAMRMISAAASGPGPEMTSPAASVTPAASRTSLRPASPYTVRYPSFWRRRTVSIFMSMITG